MLLSAVGLVGACEGSDLDDTTTAASSSDGSTTSGVETDTTSASASSTDSTIDPTASSTVADTTEGLACDLPPVEEEILGQLFIDGHNQGQVPVDSVTALRLSWIDFGFPTEVEACVEWGYDAQAAGISIDADGVLTVGAEVPAGTLITVIADVEDGRRIIMADLTVYEPLTSPILGYWSEVLQLPCDGSPAFMPDPTIPELIFYDTGDFTVTWTPFEVYVDYWGTFTHDEVTGALSLTVTGGNYVPDDVDGEGTATVAAGQLTLEDMWLGTAQTPVTPAACGHVFE